MIELYAYQTVGIPRWMVEESNRWLRKQEEKEQS